MSRWVKLLIAMIMVFAAAMGAIYWFSRDLNDFDRTITREMSSPLRDFKISDADVDQWLASQQPLISGEGLSEKKYAQAQAVGVLLQHFTNRKVSYNWQSFLNELTDQRKEMLKYHKTDYQWLYSYFLHRNRIIEYGHQDGRIIDSPYPENTVAAVGEEIGDQIWETYRTIGGGNGFYTVNIPWYWQCTTFAWARFYEVYGYRSGARGNGCLHAQEIVRAHPTWFQITYYPVAGATFSTRGSNRNPPGHVGFIEAVQDGYVWVSEGNVRTAGGIRFNYKMSMEEFFTRYPNVIFASPINY